MKKVLFTYTYSERNQWLKRYDQLLQSYNHKPPSTDSECDFFKAEITTLFQLIHEHRIEAEEEIKVLTTILNYLKHPLNPQEAAATQETHPEACNGNNGRILNENTMEIIAMEGSDGQGAQGDRMAEETEYTYEDYVDFAKKIEEIKQDINKIVLVKDFQAKKMEFEKLMLRKPDLQKVVALREWLESSNLPLYNNELETLHKNIKECQAWSQKVREYFEKYERYVTDDELKIEPIQIREMTRGINQIKEEMNLLFLKEGGLENKILVFDWGYQAKLFLTSGDRGLPQSDIKYWKDLQNKAQEKNQSEILESERYKEICKQVVKYENLIEQVQEIKDQEALLLKPGSNRKDAETAGKGFKDQESVEGLIKKLMESKVLTTREEVHLQGILEKANKVMAEYNKLKQSPAYIPVNKFRVIAKQLQLLPIKLPQEVEEQNLKENRINELLREETNRNSFDFVKKIYNEYKGCSLDIPEAQEISKIYSQITRVLKGIEDASQGRKILGYEEIKNLEKQAESLHLNLSSTHINEVRAQIWLAKVGLFKTLKENPSQRPEKKIPLQRIYEYVNKGYDHFDHIHSNKEMLAACKTSIHFLEDLIREIEGFFSKISNSEDPRKETSPFSRFIDMGEKLAELRAAAVQKRISEQANQSILYKRPEPSPSIHSVQTAATSHKEEENKSHEEILGKKLKIDIVGAGLQRQVSQEVRNEEGEKVDWATREKVREKFEELVKKLEGCEVLRDVKEVAKELERKVDARYFINKANYEKRAKSICNFLVELRGYPCLRRKVLRQGLEYGEVRNYLDAALAAFDTEAYEEERKQSQISPLGLGFDMKTELEKLVAIKEKSMGNGQLPVWTPPVDFKLPDVSGLTMPDKVMKMTLEGREGHFGIEIEGLRRENSRVNGIIESPRNRIFEPVQQFFHPHLEKARSYQQNIYLPGGLSIMGADKDQQKELSNSTPKGDGQKIIEFQRTEDARVITVEKPQLLIRRIFFGKVSQKVSGSFAEREACSFDTYATRDQIYQLPRLMNNLPYFETAPAGPFLQYINNVNLIFLRKFNHKQFVNKNKTPFQKVLVGWVSAPIFTCDLFTSTLQYLVHNRFVGTYTYLPGVEINLIPSEIIDGEYERLKQALNWVCLDPEEAPLPDKQLLFAICMTDKYEARENTEMMRIISTFPGRSYRGPIEGGRVERESSFEKKTVKAVRAKGKYDKGKYSKGKFSKGKHDKKNKKWKR